MRWPTEMGRYQAFLGLLAGVAALVAVVAVGLGMSSHPAEQTNAEKANAAATSPVEPARTEKIVPAQVVEDLRLWFEPDQGRAGDPVAFRARGLGYSVYLTRGAGAVLALPGEQVLRMNLIGANPDPRAVGEEQLEGVSNYLIGNDRDAWRTEIPHFGRVRYEQVYPGIDLAFYGSEGQLEYDLIVGPGMDPSQIRMLYRGAEEASIAPGGDLVFSSASGELVQKAPLVYQESGGNRRKIDASFKLVSGVPTGLVVGFELGDYDPGLPLVIDPKIDYSTYIGGVVNDLAQAVAVDSSGNIYVTGYTHSPDFPTKSPIYSTRKSSSDVFVTKLNPAGSSLVYSTYLGGNAIDAGYGIAVDSSGNVYVAGETTSTDFPTQNAYQPALGGGGGGIIADGFITKLNAAGSAIIFSTYWGGASDDRIRGLTLDILGNPYVAGYTSSSDFPTKDAFQASLTGGGMQDAFVSKLNDVGTYIWYSTYMGGSGDDVANDIAVDSFHQAYVVGTTDSTDFPTRTAYQPTRAGGFDAFIAKLTSSGGRSFLTYYGGSADEQGNAIAVGEPLQRPYIAGSTESTDFPTKAASQATRAGMRDAFVVSMQSPGTFVNYATYHGGSDNDVAKGIAVDSFDRPHIVGNTSSTDFPVRDPLQAVPMGLGDGFVLLFRPAAAGGLHSSYLGGSSTDLLYDIAVDGDQNAYVVGETYSSDFPTLDAFRPSNAGGKDAVLTRIEYSYLDFFLASVINGSRFPSTP